MATEDREQERARSYHHGDLRDAVLQTAQRIVEEDGVAAVSIRKIAKAVGVSHQAPYRHFRSREHIIEALRARGFLALAKSGEVAQRNHPKSARLQLESVARAYVAHAMEYPELYKLMFGASRPLGELEPEHRACAGEAFEALATIVGQSQPPHSKRVLERTRIFWATLHGIATLKLNGFLADDAADPDVLIRSACRTFLSDWG